MILPIVDYVKEFNEAFDGLCTLKCTQEIMNYYGIPDAFQYIDIALNAEFSWSTQEKNTFELAVKNCLLLNKYQSKIERFSSDNGDTQKIYEVNKKTVDSGIPVIVDLDLYEMEYSKTYQIYHNKHSVILGGYCENNPVVIDMYQWKYKGEVPFEQYIKGRSSSCPRDNSPFSGIPIQNGYYIVEKDGWKGDIAQLLYENLSNTLKNYYETPAAPVGEVTPGIQGLRMLSDLMVMWKQCEFEDRVEKLKPIRQLGMYLKTQLSVFKYYITKASEKLGLKETQKLNEELTDTMTKWDSFTRLLIKAFCNSSLEYYERVIARFNEMIDIEEARYDAIKTLSTHM